MAPIVPHSSATVAAPVHAISRARRYWPAPPSSCRPWNDRGAETERHRLQDIFEPGAHRVAEGGFGAQLSGDSRQRRDDRLVIAMLIKPGTPTLRMAENSSQRGMTPRKRKRTIARDERK